MVIPLNSSVTLRSIFQISGLFFYPHKFWLPKQYNSVQSAQVKVRSYEQVVLKPYGTNNDIIYCFICC